ncbi:MAG: hypothetical protein GQ574_23680 [Crocinitomix sp.]|nr:hypothetical protein [Crocinitomix sp.]
MKHHLILLTVLIVLIGCSKSQNSKTQGIIFDSIDSTFTSSGKLCFVNYELPDSSRVSQYYFPNTQTLKHHWHKKNGKEDGLDVWKYDNGNIDKIFHWKNGVKIGIEKKYYCNGKLRRIKNQATNATLEYFLTNENIKTITTDTITARFYMSGALREKEVIIESSRENYYYHENGQLAFSGINIDNDLHKNNKPYTGEILCLFVNGDTALFESYAMGKLEGESKRMYNPETFEYIQFFDKGKHINYRLLYFDNGLVEFEHYIVNDSMRLWCMDGEKWK